MLEAVEQTGTRARIIEVAGELFAAQGFRGTTVRDICSQAGVNVAAVNYHFRDKERLYTEVLQHAHRHCSSRYPIVAAPGEPAEARLRGFISAFLHRLLDEGRPAWHGKLMAMEIADPTPALDSLVEEAIVPMFMVLQGICRDLLGPEAAQEEVEHCAGSIIGQCLHYKHAKPVIVRMGLWRVDGPEYILTLVEHIVAFSLGGVAQIRERQSVEERNSRA